jgi:hypothetical protein
MIFLWLYFLFYVLLPSITDQTIEDERKTDKYLAAIAAQPAGIPRGGRHGTGLLCHSCLAYRT